MKKDDFAEKINSEFTENIFEDMFKFAAAKRADEIANEYPSDDEIEKEVKFSDEFSKNMSGFFRKNRRKENRRRSSKILLKVAAIIIIFLLISTVVIYNVEAIRIPVLNFFNEISEKSTTIYVQDENADYTTVAENIHGLYLPSFIPDGYSIYTIINQENYKMIIFKDKKNESLIYKYIFDGDSIVIDSENAQLKQITVNDDSAQLYLKKGLSTLFFSSGDNKFMIQGYISEQVIISMAQSIKVYN